MGTVIAHPGRGKLRPRETTFENRSPYDFVARPARPTVPTIASTRLFTPHSAFCIHPDGLMTAGPRIGDVVADLAFLRPDGEATRLSNFGGPLLLVFLRHLH